MNYLCGNNSFLRSRRKGREMGIFRQRPEIHDFLGMRYRCEIHTADVVSHGGQTKG